MELIIVSIVLLAFGICIYLCLTDRAMLTFVIAWVTAVMTLLLLILKYVFE